MKPINEMNLSDLADYFDSEYSVYGIDLEYCADRLRQLHELTRWIPVSERLPTEADADENGEIYIWSVGGSAHIILLVHALDEQDDYHIGFTHWRRIDKP